MATDYVTVVVESASSTQDVAAAEYETSSRPVLVVTEAQPHGRGRHGRTWWQADRALFSSFAFRPSWPTEDRALITLLSGLAVRQAIRVRAGVTVALRWPNDLVFDGGKVGGILAEASDDRVIVGCGVNLWWPEPPGAAIGLFERDPGPEYAESLAHAWVDELLTRVAAAPGDWNRDEYRDACVTIGTEVGYQGGTGTAIDITSTGSLLVDTGRELVTVHAGEVWVAAQATLPSGERQERR
ncbi:MAG: biotin--[acetyl-CoA-carboxylase] ligase [Actinomycetota bacterium]|nr:biotin--[acetyl-CoA-carboxylase] ligase [Actinomycetota bacterium]